MNKPEHNLALSVVAALATGIAVLYTLLEYRYNITAVVGVSAVFLITAYILIQNVIAISNMKSKSFNVQLKNVIDDISHQIEQLNGEQTQIGKATYLQIRQTAQNVTALEENYADSQETLYKNLTILANTLSKATKLLAKCDQSSTVKVIASIKEMQSNLNTNITDGFDHIQPDNSDIVTLLQSIDTYLKSQSGMTERTLNTQLNNVAHELQNISNSIQNVQERPIPATSRLQTVGDISDPNRQFTEEEIASIFAPDTTTDQHASTSNTGNAEEPKNSTGELTTEPVRSESTTDTESETGDSERTTDHTDLASVSDTVSSDGSPDSPAADTTSDKNPDTANSDSSSDSPAADTVSDNSSDTAAANMDSKTESDTATDSDNATQDVSSENVSDTPAETNASNRTTPDTTTKQEAPAIPASTDPNKKLSPDEIAALFASIG